jgi:hypothetical protein
MEYLILVATWADDDESRIDSPAGHGTSEGGSLRQ